MEINFATMLMYDAIDTSIASAEAKQKINENDEPITVDFHNRHRHTVQERRKHNAKAKAYIRPECGIWPAKIREMQALNMPGADKLIVYSAKGINHERHLEHAYDVWSREEAKRERHPKNIIDDALEEFELERLNAKKVDDIDESFVFTGETLSTFESLEIFENMPNDEFAEFADWRKMDELIDNGELYFTPQGGLYIASTQAFNFVCEHQDAVLALIS